MPDPGSFANPLHVAKPSNWWRSLAQATLRRRLHRSIRPFSETELQKSALVIAPHQDDETLGCGGTILRKTQQGAVIDVAFVSDGAASHTQFDIPQITDLRQREALAAAAVLGVRNVYFLGFPDGKLAQSKAEISLRIADLVEKTQPRQLFIPYRKEPPRDHSIVCECLGPTLDRTSQPLDILQYPIWFWNFWPWMKQRSRSTWVRRGRQSWRLNRRLLVDFDCGVDISSVRESKFQALCAYQSQMEKPENQPDWPTLGEVANGDFLPCFFHPIELFAAMPLCELK